MVGYQELLVIFMIVLIMFGGKRIPEVARGLGKGMREFRKAKDEIEDAIQREVNRPPPPPAPAPITPASAAMVATPAVESPPEDPLDVLAEADPARADAEPAATAVVAQTPADAAPGQASTPAAPVQAAAVTPAPAVTQPELPFAGGRDPAGTAPSAAT